MWMKVTADEYELPVCVADTARELAEMTGVTIGTVVAGATRARKGIYARSRYVVVDVGGEEQ